MRLPIVVRCSLSAGALLPEYKTDGASGMDLCSVEHEIIPDGERALIRTGIAIELPDGYEAQVRPRSSLSRGGVVVPLGTIDADYRGEICVILLNHSGCEFQISPGDRIAQLVVAPVARVKLSVYANLTKTGRGSGGFGSTGRR